MRRAQTCPFFGDEMKKWCEGIFFALALVCILGAVFLHGIRQEGRSEDLYGTRSRQAVWRALGYAGEEMDEFQLSGVIGMEEQQQAEAAKSLANFMRGKESVPGFLNEKEQVHMQDVRNLMEACERWAQILLWIALLFVLGLAWLSAGDEHAAWWLGRGVFFLLVFCAAGVAVFSFVGFERLFYGVHHLLFDNDFWILDPKTDILIRMMPQTLFEETFLRVLKKTLIQSGLITAVFAAVFVYMRKRVRQWTGK